MWMKIGLLRLQSTMKIQEAGTVIIFKKWQETYLKKNRNNRSL